MLNVYYNRMVTTVSKETAAITGWQVISDLGGSLGLCLGASLCTVVEFLEFFSMLFVACVQKCTVRKRVEKVLPF